MCGVLPLRPGIERAMQSRTKWFAEVGHLASSCEAAARPVVLIIANVFRAPSYSPPTTSIAGMGMTTRPYMLSLEAMHTSRFFGSFSSSQLRRWTGCTGTPLSHALGLDLVQLASAGSASSATLLCLAHTGLGATEQASRRTGRQKIRLIAYVDGRIRGLSVPWRSCAPFVAVEEEYRPSRALRRRDDHSRQKGGVYAYM